jgi:DNA-binding HxlR family transcriptional regulator
VISWSIQVNGCRVLNVATKRSYQDPCGIARALDAVGERWALLVVRELMLGPKRFSDLNASLAGISTDILAERLRELEQVGVLTKATLPPPAAAKVYQLTARGHELRPVLLALGRWGSRQPFGQTRQELGTDAFALALPTVFDAGAARAIDATVALDIGDDHIVAGVRDGLLTMARDNTATTADATITADVATLREVLWRGRSMSDAVADGAMRISGNRRVARKFLKLFPLPA